MNYRRLSSNADQTSLDRGERISLGSKSEGETAEVAVGDLIDISPDAGMELMSLAACT